MRAAAICQDVRAAAVCQGVRAAAVCQDIRAAVCQDVRAAAVCQTRAALRVLCVACCLQVPSWLNFSHPQVTIVPHSSIFPDSQHLPTFNSRAIQSNIVYIPGAH